jgi:hypothetical protein
MPYSIQVCNPYDSEVWNRTLSAEEYLHLEHVLASSPNLFVRWPLALFRPVRTNNLCNCCKDLFVPARPKNSLRASRAASKIFSALAATARVLTFPVRLLTLIPTVIWNGKQKEHALVVYLKTHKAAAKFYTAGCAKITLRHEQDDPQSFTLCTSPYGRGFFEGRRIVRRYSKTAAFIPTPEGFIPFDENLSSSSYRVCKPITGKMDHQTSRNS